MRFMIIVKATADSEAGRFPPHHEQVFAEMAAYHEELAKAGVAEPKTEAEFWTALDKIKAQEMDPLETFETAIRNVSPLMEVRSRRVGGANYQVPREVKADRRLALAMRWIRDAAKSKKGKPMAQKLSDELVAAFNNEGSAVKKKEDTHRMADANKAFAHFSW